jgi:hypothetical protein
MHCRQSHLPAARSSSYARVQGSQIEERPDVRREGGQASSRFERLRGSGPDMTSAVLAIGMILAAGVRPEAGHDDSSSTNRSSARRERSTGGHSRPPAPSCAAAAGFPTKTRLTSVHPAQKRNANGELQAAALASPQSVVRGAPALVRIRAFGGPSAHSQKRGALTKEWS